MTLFADRTLRRQPNEPEKNFGDEGEPKRPDIERPSIPNELLKRLKNVDPDQAKKYRQRSGQ